jgi:putative NIF3 family GTP cyclohydrolase 1 type 2
MKLGKLYNLVVKFGSQRDPRKGNSLKSYPDSAILFGDLNTEVRKVLVGVDMEVGEILLADKIRSQEGMDLVISHHPEGRGYALLYDVMWLQLDLLKKSGVPVEVARKLLQERIWEVERRILPQNHMRAVDAARLVNMPFMCMHTPADNHVFDFLKKLMQAEKPRILKDVVDILLQIPEYQVALRNMTGGPRILLGSPKRKVGKILFEMTGGTEGSKDVFGKLYKAGVRTLISMHLSDEHLKKAKEAGLSVVIAGHISSDTLGLNLLLDRIEKVEQLDIIGCSGFKRIKRII